MDVGDRWWLAGFLLVELTLHSVFCSRVGTSSVPWRHITGPFTAPTRWFSFSYLLSTHPFLYLFLTYLFLPVLSYLAYTLSITTLFFILLLPYQPFICFHLFLSTHSDWTRHYFFLHFLYVFLPTNHSFSLSSFFVILAETTKK